MAYGKRRPTLALENAHIMFRNFAGNPDKFNRNGGVRSFNVRIDDPELAEQLMEDGWNIKILAPREEGDKPTHHVQVFVGYKIRPPKVMMISGGTMTELTEETISTLDYADIMSADVEINPGVWEDDNGNERVKAWLKEMYVTIEKSAFADKYAMEEFPCDDDAPF